MKFFPLRPSTVMILGAVAWVAASCAPRPPYRTPAPPVGSAPAISRAPQPAPPPTEEFFRRPVPQDGKIREQDLKSRGTLPAPGARESARETSVRDNRTGAEPMAPPLADDSSLLAKITPATGPQRAASLRLTDEGRKLLDAGDAQKALGRLEKTIVVDSTNPYGYFYLAKAQFRLGRYQDSLNFLDVAESRLDKEPFWLAEVQALRGENYRALGMIQKAEASYAQALRLNSGNRTAAEALSRLQGESQPASR